MPLLLYRLRLGRVLGKRFLLLTHRGRRTGRARQTVIEVVEYDRDRMEATVISAWGERADWVRNLRDAPAISVQLGSRRYESPAHRLLTAAECDALLRRYRQHHRLAAWAIGWIFRWPTPEQPEEWRAFITSLRAVAFRLDGAS